MLSPFLFRKLNTGDKKKKPPNPDASSLNEKRASLSKQFSVSASITTNQPTSMSPIITTEQIKALRDQTGISVMQCKRALEEADGDIKKALFILRKKSGEFAAKKSDRTFKAGTVQAYIHTTGTVGTIVELDCETDFVSDNDEFKALARDIAMHVTATNPRFLNKDDIKESDMKAAREVFEAEVKGKPDDVRNRIITGKLDNYFAETVLLDQAFIKNPEITIQGLIDAAVQKFGEKIAVARFKRFKALES